MLISSWMRSVDHGSWPLRLTPRSSPAPDRHTLPVLGAGLQGLDDRAPAAAGRLAALQQRLEGRPGCATIRNLPFETFKALAREIWFSGACRGHCALGRLSCSRRQRHGGQLEWKRIDQFHRGDVASVRVNDLDGLAG